MNYNSLIKTLGYVPKEGASGVYYKVYDGYTIEVEVEKKLIVYGDKIKAESKTTQNFSQAENWVVLECVDRLLEKGYKPENITLEKTWKTGHGTSGRLDVLVSRDDGTTYLMIECKTWGKEYEKERANIFKNGGQLITYFQQDQNADVLMLYTSRLTEDKIEYQNEIIKIEDHYREAGNVVDVFERWNKLTNENGIFESWVQLYQFENKRLVYNDLKDLDDESSKELFHKFLSILRKHAVSDKPNAFSVIFDLFLSKLWDEKDHQGDNEMDFQWKENEDDAVGFQYRLLDLYRSGMKDFLEKEVVAFKKNDFNPNKSDEEIRLIKKKALLIEKVFNIKSVIDEESFEENHKVLKEFVELIQGYKIRYPRKQQHLSDFFELLLTTGLKQEVGQYFTPPPIARFITRSIPTEELLKEEVNQAKSSLPAVIDYAVGSGHFLTEIMEEYQNIIEKIDISDFKEGAKKKIKGWRADPYEWAGNYIYGVDKDYRLVKVAKVGCYFYGDGLAQVIYGDGLDNFSNSKSYRGLLKDNSREPQFSMVLSNPPYSVSAFKTTLKDATAREDFDLYKYLTDRSSEIECLFIERTDHLLKEQGIAAVILPSSILSNGGIYTHARELILQKFEIIGITELGSNTFMATGTNTVVLFLRKRAENYSQELKKKVAKAYEDKKNVTIEGIENSFTHYLDHVWEGLSWSDYQSLLDQQPNEAVQAHELYQEYKKKLKVKKEADLYREILQVEQEKMYYFLIAYPQKVVVVKTGKKNKEKQFLGYEFSHRRGSEGMHPIQRSKTVDECTQLYNPATKDDPMKASTYVYHAFLGQVDLDLPDTLKEHISYQNLTDMMTYDCVELDKSISLNAKKKVKIESKWEVVSIGEIADTQYGYTEKALDNGLVRYLRITDINDDGTINTKNEAKYINPSDEIIKQFQLNDKDIVIARSGSVGKSAFFKKDTYEDMIFASYLIRLKLNKNLSLPEYLFHFTKSKNYWNQVEVNSIAVTQPNLNAEKIKKFKIPLPPLDVQEQIVAEIEKLEQEEESATKEIENLRGEIERKISKSSGKMTKLEDITSKIGSGATPRGGKGVYKEEGISLIRSQNVYDNRFDRDGLVFIDEKQAEKLNNVKVEENDVLFNITGASIARCCLVDNSILPARVNQHVSIIRPTSKVLSKYLQKILSSETYKILLLEIGEGATSRQAITKSDLEEFKIPLPPLSEQKKIVSEIEKLENNIKELENQLAQIPDQKEAVIKKYL